MLKTDMVRKFISEIYYLTNFGNELPKYALAVKKNSFGQFC